MSESFDPIITITRLLASSFSFTLTYQTESYSFHISEDGAKFAEDVEVDVDNQTEVFRVPKHNDVDAMEIMNDFKAVSFTPLGRNCDI